MSRECVLIVEDDPIVAGDAEQALEDAGYRVCGIAASEAEALELGDRFEPTCAVIDVNLSSGDGRAVANHLWRRWRTGVIFATAMSHEINGLTETGAVACLPKPYDSNDLPGAVEAARDLVDGRTARRPPGHMIVLSSR